IALCWASLCEIVLKRYRFLACFAEQSLRLAGVLEPVGNLHLLDYQRQVELADQVRRLLNMSSPPPPRASRDVRRDEALSVTVPVVSVALA
ncbi:MAG: hypothetical protein ACTSVD_08935, partial [Candidatus Thorarchaeota archaeon]